MTTEYRGALLPSDLMDRLIALDVEEGEADGLDLLFEAVDDALYYGHAAQSWPEIDALLADPRWTERRTTLLVGALVITLPIKSKLANRGRIVEIIRERPNLEERAERILSGLE